MLQRPRMFEYGHMKPFMEIESSPGEVNRICDITFTGSSSSSRRTIYHVLYSRFMRILTRIES